jgi:hypothetical protein
LWTHKWQHNRCTRINFDIAYCWAQHTTDTYKDSLVPWLLLFPPWEATTNSNNSSINIKRLNLLSLTLWSPKIGQNQHPTRFKRGPFFINNTLIYLENVIIYPDLCCHVCFVSKITASKFPAFLLFIYLWIVTTTMI